MKLKRSDKTAKRERIILLIVTGVIIGIVYIFSRSTTLSEWYMTNIYPIVAASLSFFSSLFPFSMYDLFIIIVLLLLIRVIVLVIIGRLSFSKFIFSLIRLITIIVAWFYFSWGIAYFREDFYRRSEVKKIAYDREIFRDFAVRFIDQANRYYVDCSAIDLQKTENKIEESYRAYHHNLKIAYPNGKRKVKQMMFEPVYSKMGISGYFGPFFNELHVNRYSLNFTYPFTVAHEMAHQFGIATESEANLYAFVVCARSNDEKIRYSAYISTMGYVLNDIHRFLPDEYESLIQTIRPEIISDIKQNRAHWLAARSKSLSDMQDRVYDSYLKTNKVSSGQANYSEVVGLLISGFDVF